MPYEMIWDLPIALYLFLAGLGAGAFLAAAVTDWTDPTAARMRHAGLVIAPVAVAIGLVLLMIDARGGLFAPWRFFYLLTNFSSVMTWGVVFLGVFEVCAIAALVLDLRKRPVPSALKAVGCIAAACVAVYTGVLLGVARAFPLWNSAVLPLLFLVSACSAGVASVLLYGHVRAPEEVERATLLQRIHLPLPWIEVVLLICLLCFTAMDGSAGAASVASLMSGSWAVLFWIGFVIVGLVIPIGIELYEAFRNRPGSSLSPAPAASGAVADGATLVGGFLLRYLVVVAAIPVLYL